MAKLILTEEEEGFASWRDLDDASLGKMVKAIMADFDLPTDQCGTDAEGILIAEKAAALRLVLSAYLTGSVKTKVMLGGATYKGKSMGDWTVTAKLTSLQQDPVQTLQTHPSDPYEIVPGLPGAGPVYRRKR